MSRGVVLKPIDATPEQIAEALFRKPRRKPEPRQMTLDLNEKNLNTIDGNSDFHRGINDH